MKNWLSRVILISAMTLFIVTNSSFLSDNKQRTLYDKIKENIMGGMRNLQNTATGSGFGSGSGSASGTDA
jgi:hypothetical protein